MKLLVVDHLTLVRAAISQLIRHTLPDCEIVEAGTVTESYALTATQRFDLVVIDPQIAWSEGGEGHIVIGLELLHDLSRSESAPPILIMSTEGSQEFIDAAIQCGATAVVPKSSPPEHLSGLLCLLLKDEVRTADTQGADTPAQPAATATITPKELGITPRMHDVLRLALEGHPAWKITEILKINGTNVRIYMSKLYQKFSVINQSGLQAHFVKNGQILAIIASPRPCGGDRRTLTRRQSRK